LRQQHAQAADPAGHESYVDNKQITQWSVHHRAVLRERAALLRATACDLVLTQDANRTSTITWRENSASVLTAGYESYVDNKQITQWTYFTIALCYANVLLFFVALVLGFRLVCECCGAYDRRRDQYKS
jgi:hypothetical protein